MRIELEILFIVYILFLSHHQPKENSRLPILHEEYLVKIFIYSLWSIVEKYFEQTDQLQEDKRLGVCSFEVRIPQGCCFSEGSTIFYVEYYIVKALKKKKKRKDYGPVNREI